MRLSGLVLLISVLTAQSAAGVVFYPPPEPLNAQNLQFDRDDDIAPLLDLNGAWMVSWEGHTANVKTPSSYSSYEGKVTFRRRFNIPLAWQGRPLSLISFGIQHRCIVYVNGLRTDSVERSALPFQALIPAQFVRYGADNELLLEVDNRRAAFTSLPLRSAVLAPQNFGGLTRELFLQAVPTERIALMDCALEQPTYTPDQANLRSAVLNIAVETNIHAENPALLRVELFDQHRNLLQKHEVQLKRETSEALTAHELNLPLADLALWQSAQPRRYYVVLSLWRDAELLDRIERPVALRSEIRAEQLRGIVRVEQWISSGASASRRQIEQEVQLLDDLGINAIRCAFTPPHPYFLQLCDSLGINVFLEISLSGVSECMLWREDVQATALGDMRELQKLAERHPCVAALGFGGGFEAISLSASGAIRKLMLQLPSSLPYYAVVELGSERVNRDRAELHLHFGSASQLEVKEAVVPQVLASLGSATGASGELAQSDALIHRLNQNQAIPRGFFVAYLSDWIVARSLICNPPARSPTVFYAGLCDLHGQQRAAFSSVRNYLIQGIFNSKPPAADQAEEAPWWYLIIAVLASVLALWAMRQNSLLRKNLIRSTAHAQALFSDVRNRRFPYPGQTLSIAALICIGLGNLCAQQCFSWRTEMGFSALLGRLMPADVLLANLRICFWSPYCGLFLMSSAAFCLSLSLIFAFRLGSLPLKRRLNLRQSADLIYWAGTPLLLILPLSAIYLRAAGIPILFWSLRFVILLLWGWSYVRLLRAASVTYRSSLLIPLMIGVGLPTCLGLLAIIRLQYSQQTLYYFSYFLALFLRG